MSNENKTDKKLKTQIHCPVSGCLYFAGSERYFKCKKFLNQHIAKVHAEKKYSCSKCQKSFGLEWWCNYHEKSCGIDWKCDCGLKYKSREALLTHCRRVQHEIPEHAVKAEKIRIQHEIPEHAVKAEKMKRNIAEEKSNANPVIFLIQPIIQNMTCIQHPVQKCTSCQCSNARHILPKAPLPLDASPVSTDSSKKFCSPSCISSLTHPSKEGFGFSSNNSTDSSTSPYLSTCNPVAEAVVRANLKQSCTTGTQTVEFSYPRKTRESRASQCSRRKSKRTPVGGESIQTQTAESAVVKISKRRSRRKSVAITTDPNMLGGGGIDLGHSLWSGLKDLMVPNSENSIQKAFKNCASTQTSSDKVLCDSQTLTDEELFKFVLDHEAKKDSSESLSFNMLPNMTSSDSISMIQQNLMQEKSLPCIDIFSSNTDVVNSILSSNNENHSCTETQNSYIATDNSKDNLPRETSMFSEFSNGINKGETDEKAPPTLSDIHTQTMASNFLDYHLLANMETQTTDDFTLYDLEFSDTETQTPWEDFPNIDDSLLQADQLSIEIQTDYSFLNNSDCQQDPYDFINGLNMNAECSSKETFGVNIETQTQDRFTFPQFTNSECQTLDLSHMFPTQTD